MRGNYLQMKVTKKILFLCFSAFLIYQSYDLMNDLFSSKPEDLNTKETLFVSFLINLFITGVFAFPGFVFPTNRILPSNYYKLKSTSSLMKVYRILGIPIYRNILLILFWGKEKNRKKYFNGTKSGLENFIYQSKQSEFGHFSAFVCILLISLVLLAKGYFLLVLITTFINIIGNLYPLILQRYHRLRIEKLTFRFTK